MNKKVIYGIIFIAIVILAVVIGIKSQPKKEKDESLVYTYDYTEEKTFKSQGVERNFVVKQIGKDFSEGTYTFSALDEYKTNFLVIISDVYQDNPDLLPAGNTEQIVTNGNPFTTELKNNQYVYMIKTSANDIVGKIKINKK